MKERWKVIEKIGIEENAALMRTRLELCDIGRNQGNERKCKGCKQEEETIEHIMECREVKNIRNMMVGRTVEVKWVKK